MGEMTRDTWWEMNILLKLQVPSSHVDTQLLSDRGETCSIQLPGYLEEKDDRISYKGFCGTAAATPDLLTNCFQTQRGESTSTDLPVYLPVKFLNLYVNYV